MFTALFWLMKMYGAYLFLFSFGFLQAENSVVIPEQSRECKVVEAKILKSGKVKTDEDFQRIGTMLPKDVYARVRKNMDNGEKITAVREIRACLKTGLMESKRIVELLP